MNKQSPPARGRHEKRIPFKYERSHSAGRDSQPVLVHRPGVTYVRSRSQSPHILRPRQRYSKHDLDTIMIDSIYILILFIKCSD
jgi:hypothetical protein